MRFDIIGNAIIPDTPPIPNTLVELPPIPPADTYFEWGFRHAGNPPGTSHLTDPPTTCAGQNQINGLPFDPFRIDHVVLKGSTEEWASGMTSV